MIRPTYSESVSILKQRVEIIGDALAVVTRNPRHDDEELGPSLFRMDLEGADLVGLTLPGLHVARSSLRRCSFRDTDMHFSTLNWSDFTHCDFTGADLEQADLRACRFVECDFTGASLARADLRGSTFERCTFSGARLEGALLFRRPKILGVIKRGPDQESLPLTADQRREAIWMGEMSEPGGG